MPISTRPGARQEVDLLAVTSELPWPLDCGGHLRTFHLLRTIAATMSVRLVVPHQGGGRGTADPLREAGLDPYVVDIPPRTAAREARRFLGAQVRREPYVLFARHRHRPVRARLRREVWRRPPSILYLDHLDSLMYARVAPSTPLVLDLHNVYSQLAARTGADTGGLRGRFLQWEARRLERMERRAAALAHTIFAVSEDDARWYREIGARHVVVVPNGVDCAPLNALPAGGCPRARTLLFVGSLGWAPNVQAVRFLVTEALPGIRRRLPGVRLQIVGRNASAELKALVASQPGVQIDSNVPDVVPFYREASAFVVPLEAGGGTRLKILEAFAAGVPVLSTPIGCEGIDGRANEHLVVAERAAFVNAAVRLLERPVEGEALARAARQLANDRYDWTVVGARACRALADDVSHRDAVPQSSWSLSLRRSEAR
jgi:glycosyltransferase involved in cell wall biosynthesis